MKSNERNQGKKSTTVVIIVLSLVIVVLLCLVAYFLFFNKNYSKTKKIEKETTQNVKPMIIQDSNDAEDAIKKFNEDSSDTMYNCRMTSTWTFQNGKAKSEDAYVANTDYNHYPVYFEVQLNDTQEIVYTSSLIPVGYEVNGLTLEKDLPAGDYPATVIYHLMNDDNQEVSSVGFTITIQVLH